MPLTRFDSSARVALGLLMLALAGCQAPPPRDVPQAMEAPRKGLNPEQIAVLKEQGFQLKDEGWEFDMYSKVLFGNDSNVLTAASRSGIERIGRALIGVQIDRLRLEGHTDSVGNPEYNQRLSVARAASVGKVLIGIGMRPENLDIRGLGMTKPVADNKTASGRHENRRVVIIVPGE